MFIDGGSFKKLVDLLTSNATNHDIQFYGCKVMAALAMSTYTLHEDSHSSIEFL